MTCIHCHKEIEYDPYTHDYMASDVAYPTNFHCEDSDHGDHVPEPEDGEL